MTWRLIDWETLTLLVAERGGALEELSRKAGRNLGHLRRAWGAVSSAYPLRRLAEGR